MKLSRLIEDQSREDLFKWQQEVISALPASFEVDVASGAGIYVLSVVRNGKELFKLDASKADVRYTRVIYVLSDAVIGPLKTLTIDAADFKSSLELVIKLFDLRRKLLNMRSDLNVRLVGKGVNAYELQCHVDDEAHFHNVVSVGAKPGKPYVVDSQFNTFSKKKRLGTSVNELKVIDFILKGLAG